MKRPLDKPLELKLGSIKLDLRSIHLLNGSFVNTQLRSIIIRYTNSYKTRLDLINVRDQARIKLNSYFYLIRVYM
jgi:hypothetical protein